MDLTMPAPAKSLSSSSPKRERRSEAAGQVLVAAWMASGLPQAEFARQHGVTAQRLSYWRLRQRRPMAAIDDAGFVEIPPSVPPTSAASVGASEVIVEIGGNVRVRLVAGFDPTLLRAVVSALTNPVGPC